MTSTTKLTDPDGPGRGWARTRGRRLMPAWRARADKEGEFIVRLSAMAALAGVAGLMLGFAPSWESRFWLEGAVLGVALAAAATLVTSVPLSLQKIFMGLLLGLMLPALSSTGHAVWGMASLGAGMGLIMADGKGDGYARVNIILASVLSALVGFWAAANVAPPAWLSIPGFIVAGFQWAVLGFFFGLGALPAHVNLREDPVLSYVRSARKNLRGVYRGRLDELMDEYLWVKYMASKGKASFDECFTRKARLEEALLVGAETCIACQELDLALESLNELELRTRQRELQQKHDQATDPALQSELQHAIDDLTSSLTHREKLTSEKERLELALERTGLEPVAAPPPREGVGA